MNNYVVNTENYNKWREPVYPKVTEAVDVKVVIGGIDFSNKRISPLQKKLLKECKEL